MVVLGASILGIGLLGFFGYRFSGGLSHKDPSSLLKQHVAIMQGTYEGLFHAKIVECSYDMQKTGTEILRHSMHLYMFPFCLSAQSPFSPFCPFFSQLPF